MRALSEIIIHCTATRPDFMASQSAEAKRDEIRRWHVDGNGWSDIGYHYLIDRDGQVVNGRPVERAGAHVRGRNANSIGIALLGGHGGSETDKFEDHFTPAQDAALRALIEELKSRFGDLDVNGHNQYAAKACPCFHAPRWFDEGAAASRKHLPPSAEKVIQDANANPTRSTTNWAVLTAAGGTIASTWEQIKAADPITLASVAIVVAALLYIFRERVRKSSLAQNALKELGL